MAAPLMLSVKDATIAYGDKIVFEDLSFNIHQGSKISLVGKNGAGKTTLMDIITGRRDLDAGERWQEQGVTIGYLHQDIIPKKGETVFDYIFEEIKEEEAALYAYKVDTVAAALQLNPKDKMTDLSGGQLRRAGLARALVEEPDILLLDEPTAALDPNSAEVVMQTAEQLIKKHGLTTVLITHNLRDAHRFGNRLIHMTGGRIARDLDAAAKQQLALQDMYEWFS